MSITQKILITNLHLNIKTTFMDTQMILTPVPVADLLAQMRDIVRDELHKKQQADLSEKLLTPRETADLLRVSLVTIWSWEKAGRITKYVIGGKKYFKHAEIMQSLSALQRYKHYK